jgi:N-succinyldiaminopimelate aminotransferase
VRWHDVASAVGLVAPDGAVRPTIFAEMSALATATGAVNLGQGFPDSDGPPFLTGAAVAAIQAGRNQYAPGDGIPELRRAIAGHQLRHYDLRWDPDTEVVVTTGATEAIAAAVLAMAGPGDEVIAIEPFYDSYAAVVAMAGATLVGVPLRHDDDAFHLDLPALREAFTERTVALILNSPHNPTGTVLGPDELAEVARLATANDVTVITDEVYEHLTFGAQHVPLATLPGMADRTLSVSSAGKTFSVTGWKVGWLTGPAELVTAARTIKQFLTYTSGAPLQPAVAAALDDPDGVAGAYVRDLADSLARRRDLLCAGLRLAGFDVVVPQGTYFVVADGAAFGADGAELCRALPGRVGVVAVPVSAFCRPGSDAMRSWVRFTFVKREDVLVEAVRRLARLS